MDRKIKVFISCLLIVIPVVTGIASFFVHQTPQTQNLIKPLPQTGGSVPTIVLHPTPTLYIFPQMLQMKKNDARALNMQESAKGIIIENPQGKVALTPTPVILQTGSAVIIDNPSSLIMNGNSSTAVPSN